MTKNKGIFIIKSGGKILTQQYLHGEFRVLDCEANQLKSATICQRTVLTYYVRSTLPPTIALKLEAKRAIDFFKN